jgi:hypothetical protein
LSGNDLSYHFIPAGELWIDAQVSCEETEYSIATELHERALLAKGVSYEDAYTSAVQHVGTAREDAATASRARGPVTVSEPLHRETGTGDESGR